MVLRSNLRSNNSVNAHSTQSNKDITQSTAPPHVQPTNQEREKDDLQNQFFLLRLAFSDGVEMRRHNTYLYKSNGVKYPKGHVPSPS